jgi:alpha,alpha-trehalose phosphorylase
MDTLDGAATSMREPHGLLGSYLNDVHELRPFPYAEAGYGYPEQDEVIVNVAGVKVIRLLVDEPFDVRYGELHRHERCLDLRACVLDRRVECSSASGPRVRVNSKRMESLVQRSMAAIRYDVEAVDQQVRAVIQSVLVASEPTQPTTNDPRSSSAIDFAPRGELHAHEGLRRELLHGTNFTEMLITAAMDHQIDDGPSTSTPETRRRPSPLTGASTSGATR